MKKEFLNRTTIGALLITLGFFLPWVNMVIYNVSGFELPNAYMRLQKLGEIFGEESSAGKNIGYALYILYLIPLAGGNILYCTFSETTKCKNPSKIMLLIMFSIIFAASIFMILKLGLEALNFGIGIGLYMTIMGYLLMSIDYIKQNSFRLLTDNYVIKKDFIFSKAFKIVLAFVAVFILFFISNPSHAKFEEKTLQLVDEHKFSHYVKYDDYLLFSVGKVKITDEYETVGFGCLFNVFITNKAIR